MTGVSEGCLWIVGTPIGNLEDITRRALSLLNDATLILAEDTRRTRALISHFDIRGKTVESLNQHNQQRKIPIIIGRLRQGATVVLVSDSGMPCISDPGQKLVNACYENRIKVDIAPGPSAVTTAVAASGFHSPRILFLGFLPRGKRRRRLFREHGLELKRCSFVFFESPYRIIETLEDCEAILGNIDCFVAREMTKVHQEFLRGKLDGVIHSLKGREIKGEVTVVLSSGGEDSCRGS